MKKVITYGTFDLLHYGHTRLLERARELGDYLIVGVTSDDYDKVRGKFNNQQSLAERMEAVQKTGLADEVIVEEYEGQKIDDIKKYQIDTFVVGTDWEGYFDYLKEFCHVVYLPRTEGISSTEIREEKRAVSLGLAGTAPYLNKVAEEAQYVNGISLTGLFAEDLSEIHDKIRELPLITDDYNELLDASDAVYLHTVPQLHYQQAKEALLRGKHVLCESPIALSLAECRELYELAEERGCLLVDAVRTAYSTAFNRMILLVKSGKIGDVVSVDAVCTSLRDMEKIKGGDLRLAWNSMAAWGPTALLPILELLGTEFEECRFAAHFIDQKNSLDTFARASFTYPHAVASLKVGTGTKSESELIISGTIGYVYVPAPWWKTDYFELRYENPADNKRFFYQLEGEGIRYELADFAKNIESRGFHMGISESDSKAICRVMESFARHENMAMI